MRLLALLVLAFILLALYIALRRPNGKVYPTRRDKLLRKVGPVARGHLETVAVRHYVESGGERRVTLSAAYRYTVRGKDYHLTLPTDSSKLPGPGIAAATTVREHEREVPERLTLEDATVLDGREAIRQHYLERLTARSPGVEVLYSGGRPGLSTVRDWR